MHIRDEIQKLTDLYPVLQKLPPWLQHAFIESSAPIRSTANEVLFDVDTTIQSFLLLTEGSIRVILPVKDREILLYRVQPGGCCVISICHLLGDTRYRARVEVETAITGVILPQPLFNQMVEQSPLFNLFIMQAFAGRFFEMVGLLEAVTSLRLDQRLAELLLSHETPIEITHSQLADELGSVREVVSRILKDFEAKGLIKLERGKIRILDQESLRTMS